MPNWCDNTVVFKHKDLAQLKKLARAYNRGALMGGFLPCPKPLTKTVSGYLGKGPEQEQLEKKQARNLKRYGAATWYDWAITHWGTKWDVGREEFHDKIRCPKGTKELRIGFQSAWAPPIEFYEHMTHVESFDVCAYYYEPGVGFVGKYTSTAGDTLYNFPDGIPLGDEKTALAQLRVKIPADIIEMFDLEEDIARMCGEEEEDNDVAAEDLEEILEE